MTEITEKEVLAFVDSVKCKYPHLVMAYINGSDFESDIVYDDIKYNNHCNVYYFIKQPDEKINSDGDLVFYYEVRPEINYPSYGSDPAYVVERRMELIKEAIEFAKDLEAAYPKKWGAIVRTKDQPADDKISKRSIDLNKKKYTVCGRKIW